MVNGGCLESSVFPWCHTGAVATTSPARDS